MTDDEWNLAETLARMNNGWSAGHGLRLALEREAKRLRRNGRGVEMDAVLSQVRAARSTS